MALALGLIIYTATLLDFDHLFEGESAVAAICIMAAACALVLLAILTVSKKIAAKQRN